MGFAMKRRTRASGQLIKRHRPKMPKPMRRNAPQVEKHSEPSPVAEDKGVARLIRERDEALEQQAATSKVLDVISRSTFDLPTILNTVVETAARLCKADKAQILLPSENANTLYSAGSFGYSLEYNEYLTTITFAPGREGVVGRVLLEHKPVQIDDVLADPEYRLRKVQQLGGFRTHLGLPLLRQDRIIGVLLVSRVVVQPFEEQHIELLRTFAAQAVVAIENARLLTELRRRTTDLTEALEQQIATSDVLRVINSSPGNLHSVFATMLENAVRICDANFGNIYSWDGDALRLVATHNAPSVFAEARRLSKLHPSPKTPTGRMIANKKVVHTADLRAEQAYAERDPYIVAGVELGGVRTVLMVPMLKEDELIGALSVYRQEVRPFTDKQIAVVENFAAQAVIAIENARLLTELRKSLEQQTATSEVLRVISSSPGNLQPVFASMLENAVRICGANFGNLFLYEDGAYRAVAMHNAPEAYANLRTGRAIRPLPENALGRLAVTKEAVQITDLLLDNAYKKGTPLAVSGVEQAGIRTLLAVPMLKDDHLLGAIVIYRQEVRPFSDKQIDLVKNFAAQAVIAIENGRLLNELRERTEEVEKLNQHLEQRVADQVGEIERMSRLRRFLPPQVADLIVASGSEKQLESHRREVTALFCDLRGFTGFTESADAEDVMALLRDYHAAIGEIIIKYNGTLERYAGDGVMVVFNDPVPVENPALQAVLMALEVRDAIGALTATWSRLGHEIGFGIGIAHGFATLGTIGFEGRFDYAAIGTVSNVASRLCDEAKPGQILISPRVLMKVENAVKVEPVGEFQLKGIRRPLAAYNVIAVQSSLT
jgi:GAF domain-containing protein